VECDAVTCCSLITALDKGGQWRLAEQVFVQMYAQHPEYCVLLQCLEQAEERQQVSGRRQGQAAP
jgi:pentatricopeptide repeat protein